MKKLGPDSGRKIRIPEALMNEAVAMSKASLEAEVASGMRKNPSPKDMTAEIAARAHKYLLEAFNHSMIPQAGVRENPSKSKVSREVISGAVEFFGPGGVLSEKKFPKADLEHQRWRLMSAATNIAHMVMDLKFAGSGFVSKEQEGKRSSFDYPAAKDFTGGEERVLRESEKLAFSQAMIEVEKYRVIRMVLVASVLQLITPLFRSSDSAPKGPDADSLIFFVRELPAMREFAAGGAKTGALNSPKIRQELFRQIWKKLLPISNTDMDLTALARGRVAG